MINTCQYKQYLSFRYLPGYLPIPTHQVYYCDTQIYSASRLFGYKEPLSSIDRILYLYSLVSIEFNSCLSIEFNWSGASIDTVMTRHDKPRVPKRSSRFSYAKNSFLGADFLHTFLDINMHSCSSHFSSIVIPCHPPPASYCYLCRPCKRYICQCLSHARLYIAAII